MMNGRKAEKGKKEGKEKEMIENQSLVYFQESEGYGEYGGEEVRAGDCEGRRHPIACGHCPRYCRHVS